MVEGLVQENKAQVRPDIQTQSIKGKKAGVVFMFEFFPFLNQIKCFFFLNVVSLSSPVVYFFDISHDKVENSATLFHYVNTRQVSTFNNALNASS